MTGIHKTLAIVTVAIGLVAVPAALGSDGSASQPDDRATHGVGAVVQHEVTQRPDDRDGLHGAGLATTGLAELSVAARPDDRATRGPGAFAASDTASVSRPDDRGGVRGPGIVTSPVLVATGSGGFDWGDAGIGASGGAGLILVVAVAGVLLAGRRHGPRMAAH